MSCKIAGWSLLLRVSSIRLRGDAGVAPGPGQEIEAGTRVYALIFPLDGGGRRTGFRRHYFCEGALLESCHQWIVSSIPSRSNPGHGF